MSTSLNSLGALSVLSDRNKQRRGAALAALSKLPLDATASDMRAVIHDQYTPLMDEVIVEGVRALISIYHRENARRAQAKVGGGKVVSVQRHGRIVADIKRAAQQTVRTLEVGNKVVELFDSMIVGGKRLGDTTREDLEAEVGRLTRGANAQLATANTLHRVANEMAAGETVRKATAKLAILAILEQAFKR